MGFPGDRGKIKFQRYSFVSDYQQIYLFVASVMKAATHFVDSALNHPIFIVFIGPIVAAFAGTLGAQSLAERLAKRKELMLQINGINLAIAYTANIAEAFIIMKKQIVLPASEEYQTNVSLRNAVLTGSTTSTSPVSHHILRLQNFSPIWTPIENLKETFASKFISNSKCLILLTRLSQAISSLNESILKRNEFISEYRTIAASQDNRTALYFGELNSAGHIDERYKNLMEHIPEITNDCIGYAVVLYESLHELGTKTSVQLKKNSPNIFKADFLYKDFIPNLERYHPPKG